MTKQEKELIERALSKIDEIYERLGELGAYLAADKVRIERLECDVKEIRKTTEELKRENTKINLIIARTSGIAATIAALISFALQLILRVWR